MRATVIHAERDIRVEEVPDPELAAGSDASGMDAIVRVTACAVCGSDLWPYRGIQPTAEPHRIGHEFVGVVEAVGRNVTSLKPGDFVVAPFNISDNSCANCRNGFTGSCLNRGFWGTVTAEEGFADAGQGERVRVPLADGTLVVLPGGMPDESLIPGLLTLTDVMATGHHAAVSAGVTPGSTVVVVGDGAVGLCGVIAAKRLGAARIVAMSRHQDRQNLALAFGATDIVPERGDAGITRLKKMFDGIGPDCALECVGTKEAMHQALNSPHPGGQVGFVGVPSGGSELPVNRMYDSNVGVRGGRAPVRAYIDQLLPDLLNGTIQPGKVFDQHIALDDIAEGYRAMDERRAIKAIVRP